MKASYRLGILIVLGVVAVSTALIVAGHASARPEKPRRAGQDLGQDGFPLGSYRMVERSGKVVTEADLANQIWVSSFIFTRCPSVCPRISTVMKGLQEPLGKAGVKLVSVSVDPDYDTPAVLTKYASGYEASPNGWWFLTGREDQIFDLIRNRFLLPIEKNPNAASQPRSDLVNHSSRLFLVDRGNKVAGFFDSDDPEAVRDLVAKAQELAAKAHRETSWARHLPPVNASLNGTCAVLLVIGWIMILTGRTRTHAVCMISAVVVSSLFLACYLAYHFEVGSVKFKGPETPKIIYQSILLSHTILATLGVVPLVSLTLIYAIRKRFDRHAPMARLTFPIWLYVSITGVVIYWMLYQMPLASSNN